MRTSFLRPLVCILIFSFLVSNCNIFDPRDPEPPTQLSSSFIPPTDPAIVFQNLVSAFRERSALNYVRCFADSSQGIAPFRFEPEPAARLQYADMFSSWDRQSEQRFFETLNAQVPSGMAMTLELLTITPQGLSSDSAQYEVRYKLTAPHGRASVPSVANGRSLFVLAADRSRIWAVTRWVDLALTQGDFTMTSMKGAFGQ
jgi:hypothetical protein